MTRMERSFLEDLDLMQEVRPGGQHPRRKVLDVSNALYRQLIDGGLAAVNTEQRKLLFRYREFPPEIMPPQHVVDALRDTWGGHWDDVNYWQGPSMNPERTQPPRFPWQVTLETPLRQWKSHTAGVIDGKRVSVEENIAVVRHVLGGSHHGVPKGPLRQSIVDLQDSLETLSPDYMMNGPIQQIVFIAGVTAAGLEPIAEAIHLASG